MSPQAGGYVGAIPQDRPSYVIGITPPPTYMWFLEKGGFVNDAGLTPEQVISAGEQSIDELYELSFQTATRQPDNATNLDNPQEVQALEDSLKLSTAEKLDVLNTLRSLGNGLYTAMSADIKNSLRIMGVRPESDLAGLPDAGHIEPALTFQEDKRPPGLWELVYDGVDTGKPDWKRFWGFRLPITHWLGASEDERVLLRKDHALFSATNNTLNFAGKEIAYLTHDLRPDLSHYSLETLLRQWAQSEYIQLVQDDPDGAWWSACTPINWLTEYLWKIYPDETEQSFDRNQWKSDALSGLLKRGLDYDLIHLACHCTQGTKSEFLSNLEMDAGGEKLYLEVSRLANAAPETSRRGGMVFLNACNTGKARQIFEPPGFPEKWVKDQRAQAVIATLCEVPDYFAYAFARKFYEVVFEEIKETPHVSFLAEALMKTRSHFMETYNNPLGLAYILYAYKGAYLTENTPGGAP